MVHLNRIYTRGGDDDTTALGDGSRLPKHHLRIESYGTVDEASSVIGLARTVSLGEPFDGWLELIQNDLFDVGSDLCVPGEAGEKLRLCPEYTKRLQHWIDEVSPIRGVLVDGGWLEVDTCDDLARYQALEASGELAAHCRLDGRDRGEPR